MVELANYNDCNKNLNNIIVINLSIIFNMDNMIDWNLYSEIDYVSEYNLKLRFLHLVLSDSLSNS